jgi:hypothetical protein
MLRQERKSNLPYGRKTKQIQNIAICKETDLDDAQTTGQNYETNKPCISQEEQSPMVS